MRWIDALLPQTRHHYRWLDAAVADVACDQANFRFAQGRPSIAWIVAHVTDVSDSVAEAVGGIGRALEPGNAPGGADGIVDETAWRALLNGWRAVSARTLASLEGLSDALLDSPPAVPIHPAFADRLTTRHAFWSGHVFHVAYHLGQVGMLRGALGLGWAER